MKTEGWGQDGWREVLGELGESGVVGWPDRNAVCFKPTGELNRQGHRVARCTVEQLIRELGIAGAVRSKRVITTLPRTAAGYREQHPVQLGELIHHSDTGSQYTIFRLAEHLDAAGIAASIRIGR